MTYSFKSLLNSLRGERIDQPDFRHATETSQLHGQAQLASAILTGALTGAGAQAPGTYILGGFVPSVNVLNLTITGGQALLSTRVDGQIVEGVVFTRDPSSTSKTISLSNLPDGTYNAYIRFDLREDEYLNRAFWNADAVTPAEFARVIPTRLVESWSLAVELTSPGADWTQVAQVVKAAGALTVSDRRVMYFEGSPTASPAYAPDADWGNGGSDRSSARGLSGIGGLRQFVRAIQRQLQDAIHGSSVPAGEGWFTAITHGLTDMLALDGSRSMAGDLLPDGAVTRDLGNSSFPWAQLFVGNVLIDNALFEEGVTTPATLGANENDYNPANITSVRAVRVTAASGGSTITGIANPAAGRKLMVVNIGVDPVVLVGQDAGSGASNRFIIGPSGSGSIVLSENQWVDLWWDPTSTRWRPSPSYGHIIENHVISPATMGTTEHNYAPTDFVNAHILRLTPNAADTLLTGLAGGRNGRIVTLVNITALGSGVDLTLSNDDGVSSLAVNRFALGSVASIVLHGGDAVQLWYDGASSRWRPISVPL